MNNSGTPITTPLINIDLNNAARSSSNPDMGAYEYIYSAPVHSAANDGPKCMEKTINLTATSGGGAAPYSYTWLGPASYAATGRTPSLPAITAVMAGAYTVTVTDANGCVATAQTTVSLQPSPAGTISSDVGNTAITGTPVVFTATDGTDYDFLVNGASMQHNASPKYTTSALRTGDVVAVLAMNTQGCITTYPGITMSVAGVKVNGKNFIKWNGAKIKKWNGKNKIY